MKRDGSGGRGGGATTLNKQTFQLSLEGVNDAHYHTIKPETTLGRNQDSFGRGLVQKTSLASTLGSKVGVTASIDKEQLMVSMNVNRQGTDKDARNKLNKSAI